MQSETCRAHPKLKTVYNMLYSWYKVALWVGNTSKPLPACLSCIPPPCMYAGRRFQWSRWHPWPPTHPSPTPSPTHCQQQPGSGTQRTPNTQMCTQVCIGVCNDMRGPGTHKPTSACLPVFCVLSVGWEAASVDRMAFLAPHPSHPHPLRHAP